MDYSVLMVLAVMIEVGNSESQDNAHFLLSDMPASGESESCVYTIVIPASQLKSNCAPNDIKQQLTRMDKDTKKVDEENKILKSRLDLLQTLNDELMATVRKMEIDSKLWREAVRMPPAQNTIEKPEIFVSRNRRYFKGQYLEVDFLLLLFSQSTSPRIKSCVMKNNIFLKCYMPIILDL